MVSYLKTVLAVSLQLLACTAAQDAPLFQYIENKVRIPDRDPGLGELFDDLAKSFTPSCLRVLVGGDGPTLSSTWRKPLVVIQFSGNQSENTAAFINKNSSKMTKDSCLTYMMTDLPARDVMNELRDPEEKIISRFFIAHLSSQEEAESFLLDQRLLNEEHVAAVVRDNVNQTGVWKIMTRQLLNPTHSPVVEVTNSWTLAKGFSSKNHIFPEQMGNFYGQTLRGVTLDFLPYTDYEVIPGSQLVKPKPCLDVFILDVIASQLNFTYELVRPEDGLWGTLTDEGHWVGVVGDVEFRRANFSLVLSVTLERRRSVDFTRVYYIDPLTFVTAKNRPEPPWRKLITPFSDFVWILVVLSVIVAMSLCYFFFISQSTLGSWKIQPTKAFMHVFGSFLGQSLFILPRLTAGQILLGFWFLYSLLITSYYKTSLTASLAVPSVPPTIDTLEQLLNSDLQYGMIDAKGSEYQLFSTSNVTLYQKLFKQMTFYSSDESMRRVADGEYAYIYFKSNIKTIVSTEYSAMNGETDLHIANEEFFPGGYGWAFPKGAPYSRTFDHIILKCMQSGLINKWVKDLYRIYLLESQSLKTPEEKAADRAAALAKSDDGLVVLSLNHLQGAFLALFIGYGAGIFTLSFEFCVQRLIKSRRAESSLSRANSSSSRANSSDEADDKGKGKQE